MGARRTSAPAVAVQPQKRRHGQSVESPMEPDPPRRLLLTVHSAKLAGAQLVALGQAEALARDYELVIAIGHGPLRPRFARLGTLVRAPTRVPIWGASRWRWALEVARALPDAVRLAALARRHRVEAIIANSSVLVAPVLAGRLARVPVVVHIQEAPKSNAARRLFRFHGAFADIVVAISPWIAETFSGARARVLLNPVGIALPPRSERPVRRVDALLRVLVVGTLDAHKRQDLAIEALATLRDEGVDAVLELVGSEADPTYAASLRRRCARADVVDRVQFRGLSSDVPGHMRAADVLLLPAGEVTPLVLMEAMALGTPVVAARMGSISSVVIDGESGLLVPAGDALAMARALRRIATEPALAARLSRGARTRVETHFDEARSHDRLRAELEREDRRRRLVCRGR
jgi:glycosyltransferase involved in cell wall biosynthesis